MCTARTTALAWKTHGHALGPGTRHTGPRAGISKARSQAQGLVPAFMTLKSLCVLDFKQSVALACIDSSVALALCTALFKAVGSKVGISSFAETRVGAPRGRAPRASLLSLR